MIQLTSMHWGTYRYETENGKVTALKPFEDDTAPTTIGQGILDVLDNESRITQPMVRQSWLEGGSGNRQTEKRVSDRFIAIDWDTASHLVGDELQRVIDSARQSGYLCRVLWLGLCWQISSCSKSNSQIFECHWRLYKISKHPKFRRG